MEKIIINFKPIQTLGYVQCNVPLDIMNITRQEIDRMITTNFCNSTSYNNRLAGIIEHEYNLFEVVPILNRFFSKVIPEYWRLQNIFKKSNNLYQIIRNETNVFDIWVNLQKKYEFNPLHDHTGELSFVYWINIPYDLENEEQTPSSKGKAISHPVFSFVYPDISSSSPTCLYNISVDKTYEGQMIIFPSYLQHQVTPFYTSDNYRISVAGNLVQVNNG